MRAVTRRFAHRERSPEHADDLAALEQHEVERDLRDLAGREADDEVAALPRDAAQRGLRERAADRVVHDVHAVALRQLLEPLLEILLAVIDAVLRAVLATERELVLARGRGDHARAEQRAE